MFLDILKLRAKNENENFGPPSSLRLMGACLPADQQQDEVHPSAYSEQSLT